MALITCRNCGKPVSDRAKRCPHCGCPVGEEQTERKCEECGAIIPYGANECPNCGCPVSEEQPQGSGQQTTPPPRKSNTHNWFAVCLVSVCIIGIIGIVIAARIVNGDNTKTADRKSSATTQSEQQAQTTQAEDEYEDYDYEEEAEEEEPEEEPDPNTINGHEWVDLGLSVKWATCNVGASSPEGYGNYFAWGETITKSTFTEGNSRTYHTHIGSIAGDPSYDTARANWGGTWRLPAKSEIEELINKCQHTWTTMNGVRGYKVTGPNGNSIFLPAAGYCGGRFLDDVGVYGYYWSAMPSPSDIYYGDEAYLIYFYCNFFVLGWNNRAYGYSVRPVTY